MLATTSTRLAPRARMMQARVGIRNRHAQQTRGFRFGIWSSYVDQEFQREVRRRHRRVTYKYSEALNRRQPWDEHPMAEQSKTTLRRMMSHYWKGRDSKPSGQSVNGDRPNPERPRQSRPQHTPANKEGIRPGHNIEDVERGAVDQLFWGARRSSFVYDHLSSPIQNIRSYISYHQSRPVHGVPSKPAAGKTAPATEADQDYVIDPITNRKVSNNSSPLPKSTLASSLEDTEQAPIFYDGPPPAAELEKYGQIRFAQDPANIPHSHYGMDGLSTPASSGASKSAPLPKGQPSPLLKDTAAVSTASKSPVTWQKGDGAATESNPSEEKEISGALPFWPAAEEPKYADLDKYKTIDRSESAPAEPANPQYEDLGRYKSVLDTGSTAKNLDDLQPPTHELPHYKAVRAHEPNGKYNAPAHESSKAQHADELSRYTAFRASEPDGMYKALADEASQVEAAAAELSKYAAVRASEPDGKYKAVLEKASTIDGAEELPRYTAFRASEPDGKYKPMQDEESQIESPEELGKYAAVRAHEPDGLYKAIAEGAEQEQLPDDLHKYSKGVRACEPDGMYKAVMESVTKPRETPILEALKAHQSNTAAHEPVYAEEAPPELSRYGAVRAAEPDGMYKALAREAEKEKAYDDLHLYGAVRAHEPDGLYKAMSDKAEKERQSYDDVHLYGAVRAHEPDGMYKAMSEQAEAELKEDRRDGEPYGAVRSHEPDGMYKPQQAEQSQAQYTKHMRKYGAVRASEPDGLYKPQQAQQSQPTYTDKISSYGAVRAHEPDGKYKVQQEQQEPLGEHREDIARYGPVRASEPDGKYKLQEELASRPWNHQELEEVARADEEGANLDNLRASDVRSSVKVRAREMTDSTTRPYRMLTGNFARDFPEEFTKSWTSSDAYIQAGASIKAEQDEAKREAGFIQPALDRQQRPTRRSGSPTTIPGARQQAMADPYSQAPQGLETSWAEESSGKRTWPTYVRQYGSVSTREADMEAAARRQHAHPAEAREEFMVLLADLTDAEAHSISRLPEEAEFMSTQQALAKLRVSAPLYEQMGLLMRQGYQVVSSRHVNETGQDVLFMSRSVDAERASEVSAEDSAPPVNPIDMMGRQPELVWPISTSPTGFVNYDAGAVDAAHRLPPPDRVKSNINVRREEDVFSGPKESAKQGKGRRAARRLVVGGVWVAGISYALGVVGEYFKSGGNGPMQGL